MVQTHFTGCQGANWLKHPANASRHLPASWGSWIPADSWVNTGVSPQQCHSPGGQAGTEAAQPLLALTPEQISNCHQRVSHFCNPTAVLLREEQLQTLTEERWWGWSWTNTASFGRFCCVLSRDEHLQLQNVWTAQCPVAAQESSSHSAMPSPAHLGPQMDFPSPRDAVLSTPQAKSFKPCLLELKNSSAPLCLSRISMCSFFSSPLCPFSPVQRSLNFITAFLPSASLHPHSSTLTLNSKVSLSVGNADNRLFHN